MSEPFTMILGGIVSGIGSGMMEKARAEEKREAEIAAEDRRKANYAGSGEATRWDAQIGEEEEPVGTVPSLEKQVQPGNINRADNLSKHVEQARKNRAGGPRYHYNPQTGEMEYR